MTSSTSWMPRSSSARAEPGVGLDGDLGLCVLVARDRRLHAGTCSKDDERVVFERHDGLVRLAACQHDERRLARRYGAAGTPRRELLLVRFTQLDAGEANALGEPARAAHACHGALELVCPQGIERMRRDGHGRGIVPEQLGEHAAQLFAARGQRGDLDVLAGRVHLPALGAAEAERGDAGRERGIGIGRRGDQLVGQAETLAHAAHGREQRLSPVEAAGRAGGPGSRPRG